MMINLLIWAKQKKFCHGCIDFEEVSTYFLRLLRDNDDDEKLLSYLGKD